MNKIKFIISDIDGCIADFIKPEFPLKQDLSENLKNLEEIYKSKGDFPEILFGVATARSFYQSDHIMEATGFQGPSIFEMGNVIFDPTKGVFNLFEKLEKFKKDLSVIYEFLNWRKEMFESKKLDKILPEIGLKPMTDRVTMLTYEFHSGFEDEVYKAINSLMPETIKNAIENGILKFLRPKGAIDILPNITKGEALDFILKEKSIKRDQVFAIGDSYHSDKDLLNSAGVVGCPQNADLELQAYIKERGGFISNKKTTEGLIDLISKLKNMV